MPSWNTFASPPQDSQQEQEKSQQNPPQQPQQKSPKQGDWGDYQSPMTYQGPRDDNADEGLLDYLLRGKVRLESRVAEQVLGLPGNIEKLANDFVSNIPGVPQTKDFIHKAVSELIGPENVKKIMEGPLGKPLFAPSSEFKKKSEELTGGYTSPKSKGEKELDEFTEDVVSTFLTRRSPQGAMQRVLNHFLIPTAANVTKKIVNDLGFGEDKANLAKMAVWLPLTLANNVNGPRYASDLMNRGRNGFNQNQVANVATYQNQINGVSRNMLQGDPRSALAQQQLAGIVDDINHGRVTMRDLMTRYDAINAAKRDRGLFQLNAGDRRAAIRNINEVRDIVRDQITQLGASNPQALQDWQNGVQAWSTIHRSNSITNYIQDLSRGQYAKILTGPAAALFGVGSTSVSAHPIVSGAAAASVGTGYKTGQILYRMWNNPTLQHYYWSAINAVMERNFPAFLSNYEKLNKKLENSEPTQPQSKTNK